MKKILIILPLIVAVGVLANGEKMTTFRQGYPINNTPSTSNGINFNSNNKEINAELDSLTAEGEYILMRGSNRNYDTIIDHIRYRYVTDK